jgi:hypothetical protein
MSSAYLRVLETLAASSSCQIANRNSVAVPPCHLVSAGYRPGTRWVTFAVILDYPDLCHPITLKRHYKRAVFIIIMLNGQCWGLPQCSSRVIAPACTLGYPANPLALPAGKGTVSLVGSSLRCHARGGVFELDSSRQRWLQPYRIVTGCGFRQGERSKVTNVVTGPVRNCTQGAFTAAVAYLCQMAPGTSCAQGSTQWHPPW